ncbi:RDD family protein [Rarobacter faecitabidus]|uniref:Putative RDD family membrane protein YckC n=1 Tax=Rarobacter faecitabidus TaxID=13243 RepID=A0A542ZUA9_RARFA|nr:RDD family protein [Rarobacter faecitabidus]TQL63917.1 putative RDD family membrane protein YckC [Rarobacter faecitabidus]
MAIQQSRVEDVELALLEGTVLSEGVVADTRPVAFAVRLLSGIIDALAVLLALWALMTGLAALDRLLPGGLDEDTVAVAQILTFVGAFVALPTIVETFTRGRSLGRLAMGIRIVRDDGGPIRFRHALIRALVAVFEIWMTSGAIAIAVSFFNNKGKRLGDLLAGTYAIRVRGGTIKTSPLVMPADLAPWARHADLRQLDPRRALVARQFLERAHKLAPGPRAALGNQIAGMLEPSVAPGPPPGTHPEAFIAAVLAERRDRDLAAAIRSQNVAAARHAMLTRLPFGVRDSLG